MCRWERPDLKCHEITITIAVRSHTQHNDLNYKNLSKNSILKEPPVAPGKKGKAHEIQSTCNISKFRNISEEHEESLNFLKVYVSWPRALAINIDF